MKKITNNFEQITMVVSVYNEIIIAPNGISIIAITNVEPPLFSGLKIGEGNKIIGKTTYIVNEYTEFKISGIIKIGLVEYNVKDFFSFYLRSLCNPDYLCEHPSTNPDHGKITSSKMTWKSRMSTLISLARRGRKLR